MPGFPFTSFLGTRAYAAFAQPWTQNRPPLSNRAWVLKPCVNNLGFDTFFSPCTDSQILHSRLYGLRCRIACCQIPGPTYLSPSFAALYFNAFRRQIAEILKPSLYQLVVQDSTSESIYVQVCKPPHNPSLKSKTSCCQVCGYVASLAQAWISRLPVAEYLQRGPRAYPQIP